VASHSLFSTEPGQADLVVVGFCVSLPRSKEQERSRVISQHVLQVCPGASVDGSAEGVVACAVALTTSRMFRALVMSEPNSATH
jgi:hypothetical protein